MNRVLAEESEYNNLALHSSFLKSSIDRSKKGQKLCITLGFAAFIFGAFSLVTGDLFSVTINLFFSGVYAVLYLHLKKNLKPVMGTLEAVEKRMQQIAISNPLVANQAAH
ncbi:hypothetical protein KI655_18625 [Vibrio sp. D404a]|uniref:hypothetical protein n=1 Tax=unclassified Vibrio TaxID=2614977 RepID=UPI002552BA4C|nr:MULTISPECIES: hypothetical protein [unclassified Vibrio]MDK9739314.1 hypothetical protein [Vibrio sp. D404a]MDK9797650.1 hypothetical protein [Vibrio sp. D449a]